MDVAISTNKVPVRLTEERWYHISRGHPEMADHYYEILETIEHPFCIYKGNSGELVAIKFLREEPPKFIVAIYKEINNEDGFVITAYLSDKQDQFDKKEIIWKQQ
jgi:hypothetical protein